MKCLILRVFTVSDGAKAVYVMKKDCILSIAKETHYLQRFDSLTLNLVQTYEDKQ